MELRKQLAAWMRRAATRLSRNRCADPSELITIVAEVEAPHPLGHPSWEPSEYPAQVKQRLAEELAHAMIAHGVLKYITEAPTSRLQRARLTVCVDVAKTRRPPHRNNRNTGRLFADDGPLFN
jgi:hypothetical protein